MIATYEELQYNCYWGVVMTWRCILRFSASNDYSILGVVIRLLLTCGRELKVYSAVFCRQWLLHIDSCNTTFMEVWPWTEGVFCGNFWRQWLLNIRRCNTTVTDVWSQAEGVFCGFLLAMIAPYREFQYDCYWGEARSWRCILQFFAGNACSILGVPIWMLLRCGRSWRCIMQCSSSNDCSILGVAIHLLLRCGHDVKVYSAVIC